MPSSAKRVVSGKCQKCQSAKDVANFFKLLNFLRTAGRQRRYIQAINQANACIVEAIIERGVFEK